MGRTLTALLPALRQRFVPFPLRQYWATTDTIAAMKNRIVEREKCNEKIIRIDEYRNIRNNYKL